MYACAALCIKKNCYPRLPCYSPTLKCFVYICTCVRISAIGSPVLRPASSQGTHPQTGQTVSRFRVSPLPLGSGAPLNSRWSRSEWQPIEGRDASRLDHCAIYASCHHCRRRIHVGIYSVKRSTNSSSYKRVKKICLHFTTDQGKCYSEGENVRG